MKRDHLAYDVVAETPSSEGKPILAFAGPNGFQFSNVMAACPIIRICRQNRYCGLFGRFELAVCSVELVGKPLVSGSCMNPKEGRHAPEYQPLGFLRRAARSAKNSFAGRVLPARNSCWLARIAARIFGSRMSSSSCCSSGESLGLMLITRPETLNSTRSPGLMPARRRMLFGTVISVLGLRMRVMMIQSNASGEFLFRTPFHAS